MTDPKPATHLAIPVRLTQRIIDYLAAQPGAPFVEEIGTQAVGVVIGDAPALHNGSGIESPAEP